MKGNSDNDYTLKQFQNAYINQDLSKTTTQLIHAHEQYLSTRTDGGKDTCMQKSRSLLFIVAIFDGKTM